MYLSANNYTLYGQIYSSGQLDSYLKPLLDKVCIYNYKQYYILFLYTSIKPYTLWCNLSDVSKTSDINYIDLLVCQITAVDTSKWYASSLRLNDASNTLSIVNGDILPFMTMYSQAEQLLFLYVLIAIFKSNIGGSYIINTNSKVMVELLNNVIIVSLNERYISANGRRISNPLILEILKLYSHLKGRVVLNLVNNVSCDLLNQTLSTVNIRYKGTDINID